MFYELLKPLNTDAIYDETDFHPQHFFHFTTFYNGEILNLHEYDLAIVGVNENRGAPSNQGCKNAPDAIRSQLYKLFIPEIEKRIKIVDLGNMQSGESLKDTYAALASIVLKCRTHKTVLVILGGSHDLTLGQFLGYKELMALINMIVVDEKINIADQDGQATNHKNFITPILIHNPNYLFNYSHLGYQVYLNDYKKVNTLESLNFDCHRLGLVRAQMEETEPMFRDTDMVSIDITAVRMADAPGVAEASPNGFSGEELCQLSRFAGLSDKLSSIGFYEVNPDYDVRQQTSQLTAQAVWYFIEGYYQRRGDNPINLDDFYKFTVRLDTMDHELIFWKSKRTDRWWMEMPYSEDERFRRHRLIPCSHVDYEMACNEEIPDRWMKVWNKMH